MTHYWEDPANPVKHTVPGRETRSEIHTRLPDRPGNGTSRSWTRTVGGQTYGFTLVAMPDGEIRWFVVRFNGYPGGPRFGIAWSPHREWTFKPR